ncbi:MAG: hypothetical protein PHQ43_13485, partial [Dehalococcoidales bacterium]|nr:hypothetical protein [Dehalococcoidales bacterium]
MTKTRKGWSVAGMDFTNQADAEAFAAKAVASAVPKVVPEEPRRAAPPIGAGVAGVDVTPEVTKTVSETPTPVPAAAKPVPETPKTPDQPLDNSGTAAQTLGVKKPVEATTSLPKDILEMSPLEIAREYIKSKSTPDQGSWDASATSNWANTFLAKAVARLEKADGWKTNTDLTPKSRDGKKRISQTNESLQILSDMGYLDKAWDQEGNTHYAKKGTPLPDWLTQEAENPPAPTITPAPNVQQATAGEVGLETQALPESLAPVQTREKKITEHEDIVGQTKINAVTYSKFQEAVKAQDWAKVQEELHLSSANFTRDAFDHHFNPLNLMGRLMEGGMPLKEAKALVKEYETQAFKPTKEGLAANVEPVTEAQGRGLPPGVREFQQTRGTAGRVGVPEEIMSKEGRIARASERGDLRTVIRGLGGIRSDSEILKNFEPEERRKLVGLLSKTGMGPDVMADTINKEHPHIGGFEDDAHLIRTLVDGSYKKLLNKNILEEEARYYEDYITREAEAGRVSEVDLTEAERIAEREVAAEEIAGRGAKPGEYDLEAGWPTGPAAAAFGLRPREKTASKLETRLDALQADYPDIDREKAALVIRSMPNAEDGQIVNMTADPEMFAQVAQGNLAASEKAQLLKKATDAGAQGDLFGGGERKGETLFKAGEIPLKETENGKNAPNQAGVEGRPESDLSPDREAIRRQFEDFRGRVDQELPGSQGWRAFSNAEYAEELGNSQEFDAIRQEAKAFGLSVIPVKNMGPSGAIVRDYGEQPLLIINADVKGITPTQVAGHEIFHDRRYKGHQSAINIINAVDLNSNTTKSYIEWIRSIREQLEIESPSNREVMEEIAADYAAGIEKFKYNGVSYNLKDCFRDAKQIELYLERYKESPTTEPSVNALYGYDKPKFSTPEERQGWVAPGEPKSERQPLPANIGGQAVRENPEINYLTRKTRIAQTPGGQKVEKMHEGAEAQWK